MVVEISGVVLGNTGIPRMGREKLIIRTTEEEWPEMYIESQKRVLSPNAKKSEELEKRSYLDGEL